MTVCSSDREFTEEFFLPQVEHDEHVFYGFGLEFDVDDDGCCALLVQGGHQCRRVRHRAQLPGAEVDLVVLSNSEEGAWPVIRELDSRM